MGALLRLQPPTDSSVTLPKRCTARGYRTEGSSLSSCLIYNSQRLLSLVRATVYFLLPPSDFWGSPFSNLRALRPLSLCEPGRPGAGLWALTLGPDHELQGQAWSFSQVPDRGSSCPRSMLSAPSLSCPGTGPRARPGATNPESPGGKPRASSSAANSPCPSLSSFPQAWAGRWGGLTWGQGHTLHTLFSGHRDL